MKRMKDMKKKCNELSNHVIRCAKIVHRVLGSGLLESIYQQCLSQEVHLNDISFKSKHPLSLEYKGLNHNYECYIEPVPCYFRFGRFRFSNICRELNVCHFKTEA